MSVFQLDQMEIHVLQNSSLQNIIKSCAGVFKESLSTAKEFEAEFYVKDCEKSHFCKAGTVPYSIPTKV